MLRKEIAVLVGVLGMTISGPSVYAQTTIPLINANIASEYGIISMQMSKAPGCPMVGYFQFFPGGTLQGRYVTDTARSKAISFNGSYTLTNSRDLTFTSEDPAVPVANMNGTIVRVPAPPATSNSKSVKAVLESANRPVPESFVLTTNTTACPGGTYKFVTFEEDEE